MTIRGACRHRCALPQQTVRFSVDSSLPRISDTWDTVWESELRACWIMGSQMSWQAGYGNPAGSEPRPFARHHNIGVTQRQSPLDIRRDAVTGLQWKTGSRIRT